MEVWEYNMGRSKPAYRAQLFRNSLEIPSPKNTKDPSGGQTKNTKAQTKGTQKIQRTRDQNPIWLRAVQGLFTTNYKEAR